MRDPEFEMVAKGPAPGSAMDSVIPVLRGRSRQVMMAAVGFQLLVLVGMILANTIPWVGPGARTVLLRTVPVDPRDLMRGDYVILGYDISRVPPGTDLGHPFASRNWDRRTVFVPLEPDADGRHYHGMGVLEQPPAAGLFIQGTLEPSGRIRFGIESYFVQEGRGKEYERAIRDGRVSAEVALARNGRAALRRLVIE